MSADKVMPTRMGDESASPRQVTTSAVATLLGLAGALALALVVPGGVVFAVGAGAGYSLSGSV